VLPGEADAAVDLDRFMGDTSVGFVAERLGKLDDGILVGSGVAGGRGGVGQPAHALRAGIHVGKFVLDGLE